MKILFETLSEAHREPVIDIFNHYIENDFAAYLENRVPYGFYDMILNLTKGYPSAAVINSGTGDVIGYGFLRAYSPLPVFKRSAEVSYFLHRDVTGKGTGGRLLAHLESEAIKMDISMLLANISSLNEISLRFHSAHGFSECGRFKDIGRKFGREFDVVWMQKRIQP